MVIAVVLAAVVVGAALGWFVFDAVSDAREEVSGVPADIHVDEFQRQVRRYLVNNPEVIVEAIQRLESRRTAAEQDEMKSAIRERADELLRDSASPVGGNPQGDVTLVEFSDYNCPYCRRVAPLLAEAEASDPKLRIIYKEIPILGPDSLYAAKAALAAHRQDRYVAFHRALMDAKGIAAEGLVMAVAARIGLDVERLKGDLEDPSIQAAIDRNMALARTLRITGTPSFVIGEEILRGAVDLETMQALIRQARATK
ncbi:MAG: thioredoxin domain-containing protein [Alphaproteobacteria bacterium]|nr:thioredoxin domain-containing protein [Alphaproteobacteria bacterium]